MKAAHFCIIIVLAGLALLIWLNNWGDEEITRIPENEVSSEGAAAVEGQTHAASDGAPIPGIVREAIDPIEEFWDRYFELASDPEYRSRLRAPEEARLQRLLEGGDVLPIDPPLRSLKEKGVVRPPRREVLLELGMHSQQSAVMLLDVQSQSLDNLLRPGSDEWLAKQVDSIELTAARYSPESLALMLRQLSRSEIARDRQLLEELALAREDAAVLYGLAWTEVEFYRHCAFQAALDAGIDQLDPAEKDSILAERHEGMTHALARLNAVHKQYLIAVAMSLDRHLARMGRE